MSNFEQKILDAIDIVTEKRLSALKFDKTIQGIVLECTNPLTGEYKVRYQDSVILAYSTNPSVLIYANSTPVYVSVPSNDLGGRKEIIGTTAGTLLDSTAASWAGSGVPTSLNYPTSSWTGAESLHIGDTYRDITTSQLYIYKESNGSYFWEIAPAGPTGPPGADGLPGVDGSNGVNGLDGTPIVWQGTFPSHPSSPQNGWAYYNSSDGKSYVYQNGSWYQMTIDGVNGQDGGDGLSIIWKGELSEPPINPEINWVYKDTDNNSIYIWNGLAWELMVLDGTDGATGAPGADGLSVYITYNDASVAGPSPETPTNIEGTLPAGWHTNATSASNWISQKVDDGTTANWGVPIRIKGIDGASSYTAQLVSTSQFFEQNRVGTLAAPLLNGLISIKLSAIAQNFSSELYEWSAVASGLLNFPFYSDPACLAINRINTVGTAKTDYTANQSVYIKGEDFITALAGLGVGVASIEFVLNIKDDSVTPNIIRSDRMSIFKIKEGEDAFTVILTNESHTFPADSSGNILSGNFAAGASQLRVYYGNTPLACDSVSVNTSSPAMALNTYRVTNIAATSGGMTFGLATLVSDGTRNNYQFNPTGLTTPAATRTITVAAFVGGAVRTGIGTKVLSYSKAQTGLTGLTGNFTDYIYIRSEGPPSPSITGTTTSQVPPWSNTPLAISGTMALWMSKAIKTAAGAVLSPGWSEPVSIDGSYIHIRYSNDYIKETPNTGNLLAAGTIGLWQGTLISKDPVCPTTMTAFNAAGGTWQQTLSELTIGGRNLIRNGNFEPSPAWSYGTNASESVVAGHPAPKWTLHREAGVVAPTAYETSDIPSLQGSIGCFSIDSTVPGPPAGNPGTSTSHIQVYQSFTSSIEIDKYYTISFWAKSSVSRSVFVSVIKATTPFNNYGMSNVPFSTTSSWKKFMWTFKANATVSDARINFAIGGLPAAKIMIDLVKVEEGSKATTWSPAPEDLDEIITSIASDNVLSPADKSSMRFEWTRMYAEYVELNNQADIFGINEEIDTAQANLTVALKAVGDILHAAAWTVGASIPSLIGDALLAVNSPIDGVSLRNAMTTYAEKKQLLFNAITIVSKQLVDQAKNARGFYQTTVPEIDISSGDVWINTNPLSSVRYIRDWLAGSSSNGGNHWVEIQAFSSNVNVALGKPVSSNLALATPEKITDGIISSDYANGAGDFTSQYALVDLGSAYSLDSLKVVHYYVDGRTYFGTKTEVSTDGVFWVPVYDSALKGTYAETSLGKTYAGTPVYQDQYERIFRLQDSSGGSGVPFYLNNWNMSSGTTTATGWNWWGNTDSQYLSATMTMTGGAQRIQFGPNASVIGSKMHQYNQLTAAGTFSPGQNILGSVRIKGSARVQNIRIGLAAYNSAGTWLLTTKNNVLVGGTKITSEFQEFSTLYTNLPATTSRVAFIIQMDVDSSSRYDLYFDDFKIYSGINWVSAPLNPIGRSFLKAAATEQLSAATAQTAGDTEAALTRLKDLNFYGGETVINGGNIQTGTVSAGALSIGERNVSLTGKFSPNYSSATVYSPGNLWWSGGKIQVSTGGGNYLTYTKPALDLTSGTTLAASTDYWVYALVRGTTTDGVFTMGLTSADIDLYARSGDIPLDTDTTRRVKIGVWSTDANKIGTLAMSIGQTFINGGDIQTDTISASSIRIGNFNNLVADPGGRYTADTSRWTRDAGITSSSGDVTYNYHINISHSSAINRYAYPLDRMSVTPGEKFRLKAAVKRGVGEISAGVIAFGIRWRDAYGTHLSTGWIYKSSNTLLQTWTEITGTLEAPANATQAEFGTVYVSSTTTAPSAIAFANLQVYKMTGGELVVNGAITTDSLESGSITTEKLSVTAKNLVSNPTIVNSTDNWTRDAGTGNVNVENIIYKAVTVPSLFIEASNDTRIVSDKFAIDPMKSYKFSAVLNKVGTNGSIYIGVLAYDSLNNLLNLERWDGAAWSTTMTSNPYFNWWATGAAVNMVPVEGYVVGCETSFLGVPTPVNTGLNANASGIWRMPPNTTHLRMRFLNYFQSAILTKMHYISPSVTEVGAGNISADSITAGTLTGRTIRTSATGKRVEVAATTNDLRIYDVSGLAGTLEASESLGTYDLPTNPSNSGALALGDVRRLRLNAGETSSWDPYIEIAEVKNAETSFYNGDAITLAAGNASVVVTKGPTADENQARMGIGSPGYSGGGWATVNSNGAFIGAYGDGHQNATVEMMADTGVTIRGGLPYAVEVLGDVTVQGTLSGYGVKSLPAGDGSIGYWYSVPSGWYFCGPSTLTGQPSDYGFVEVVKRYIGTNPQDFNVMWYQQANGYIWRLSGNGAAKTEWRLLSYPMMQTGSALLTMSTAWTGATSSLFTNETGYSGSTTVTFPRVFPTGSTVNVVITPVSTLPDYQTVSVGAASTTSFVAYGRRGNNTNFSVNWIAMAESV